VIIEEVSRQGREISIAGKGNNTLTRAARGKRSD
jgi:hypothetical protein